MSLDKAELDDLLFDEEGSYLDFKSAQYKFEGENNEAKSELLKDILAFVNSSRYRTAHILIGVREVSGGQNEIVGVDRHLDDAKLHQFVNSKTNRPAEFNYTPITFGDKTIGVLSIPIQIRPVYSLSTYGKVTANNVYMRDGSSTRTANPDDIADMGRAQTPRLLEWFIGRLRSTAQHAVMVSAQQWFDHPGRQRRHISRNRPQTYTTARDAVLQLTACRPLDAESFTKGIDSYLTLSWVFRLFEELADQCTQTVRTVSPSLMEFGALGRVILEMEKRINSEKSVWDEFRIRMKNGLDIIPNPANYNILSLARLAVHFVEVLEDEERYRSPDREVFDQMERIAFLKSPDWGDWRR